MRAIVNGKLYDTEKAENTLVLSLEENRYDIYMTQNGNIFATDTFPLRKILKTLCLLRHSENLYISIYASSFSFKQLSQLLAVKNNIIEAP